MRSVSRALRRYALSFPGATEDFPWGERVVKVKDRPPVEILKGWIRESYCAVAPKKLVAEVE